MSTALAIVAANTGASEEDIKSVISGMIISSKNQHGATATKAEMAVFIGVCSKYGLNPLVRECAAFISGGKLQIIVMIDAWYKMVNRQDTFDGVEFEDKFDGSDKVTSTTCKMYLTNRSRPICVTEYLAECKDAKSSVWARWPNRMLRHKAYIQAARMAFGISEVIDDDEKNRITSNSSPEKNITPQQDVPSHADIEAIMAECADLDTLKSECSGLRVKMQNNGTWASRSAAVIALNIKHKDRINDAYEDAVVVSESAQQAEEVAKKAEQLARDIKSDEKEIIEGQLVEEEIGFGDDDDFGEES